MSNRAAVFGGVAALALLAWGTGCEMEYPWDAEVPQVGDSVQDLGCGATLDGELQWNQLDGDAYPGEWKEVCDIRWELEGSLTTGFDVSACVGCRCVYDVVATVIHDGCEWYGTGTEHQAQLGIAPTMSGPEEYQGSAMDWPWIAYTDFTPGWTDLRFCYFGRSDDSALPGSYDAGELYLASYYYWNISDSDDVMIPQAWIGMSE